MEAVLLDEIIEKTASLSEKDRQKLLKHLLKGSLAKNEFNDLNKNVFGKTQKIEEKKQIQKKSVNPNIEWLKEHRAEYAGNYVALKNGELVAFGRTIKEADLKAKEKGVDKSLLHYIPAEDEEVWGGW